MKLAIYGHSGSQNHGNEAIVRGLHEIFPDADLKLFSMSADVDKKFGLDKIAEICKINTNEKNLFKKLILKRFKKYRLMKIFKPILKKIEKDRIYCLEAGDQYNETVINTKEWYSFLNKEIQKRGAETVMLGCSINEDIINRPEVIKDLRTYSMVIARESLTYNLLKKAGIKTYFAPCPAFAMKSEACLLPDIFNNKEVIGLNVGFLAQGNEKYYDMLLQNYENVTKYIIEKTDYNILLVPHVNWSYTYSDFRSLEKLYAKFRNTNRIHILDEKNAPQIKYILSKLKVFIGLRTHAQVSAISALTPTIITGYKNKSIGISNDVYGKNSTNLAHIQSLENSNTITDKLKYILENYDEVKKSIEEKVPLYLEKLNIISNLLHELGNNT